MLLSFFELSNYLKFEKSAEALISSCSELLDLTYHRLIPCLLRYYVLGKMEHHFQRLLHTVLYDLRFQDLGHM